ncbi:MAG TPA: hypothetical protein VFC57_08465 [Aeromicrobium sp.]|nr:hypothetical protein [Aeromicrobium sp.]
MEPILNRNAELAGLSRGQLRNPKWTHPTNGVSIDHEFRDDLVANCRATQMVLPPDAVFTHCTAATLRRWALPDIGYVPIIASSSAEAAHHDRRGVYVRRCGVPAGHRGLLEGVRIASAEWVVVELAETLTLIDLVAVIDSALHLKHTTLKRLRDAVVPGRRGVRVLRQALELCDGRSESRWESILRVLYQLSGIQVEPQVILVDKHGNFVARADLQIRGTNRLSEYDGAGHRERDQHRDDLRREKGLLRLGIERFGYTSVEIHRSPERIIADAEDALGWRHDPARLKNWHCEYERSSLSGNGKRALIRRLRRFSRSTTPRPSRSSSGAIL